MGYTRYDPGTWAGYAKATSSRSHTDYAASGLKSDFDPRNFKQRESRRSDVNPAPTPLIVGLDVTGSMGRVVEAMRKSLGTLFEEVIERRPISDPHVMAMAIGDFACDRAPVQATQFEADPVTIGRQIEELYLERGGGGNDYEGYLGPLYFAGMRTDCDALREGRKGFLFTIGDEEPQEVLTAADIKRFFGDEAQADLGKEDLLSLVSRGYEYFHIMVEEGSHMLFHGDRVKRKWTDFIGQRAIPLSDHTRLAEVIISTMEVVVGRDKASVAGSWSDSTALVVKHAIAGLTTGPSGGKGLRRL